MAAVLLFACNVKRGRCVDSLPTAWRQGIATNYGGQQDGKVMRAASYADLYWPLTFVLREANASGIHIDFASN